MTTQEALQACTVRGFNVYLPAEQLDRKIYMEVDKALKLIGWKWNRGQKAHVFREDPTELLAQIAAGAKRNLKKEYQFYATPPELAKELVYWAKIETDHRVLEPSAGQGAIINAIHDKYPDIIVDAMELMDINRIFLEKMDKVNLSTEKDFLMNNPPARFYDRIVANPPFTKNADIDHIRAMYALLKPGGKIVTISSKAWLTGSQKKQVAFREWLDELDAEIKPIREGAFKATGTMVAGNVIIIDKPEVERTVEGYIKEVREIEVSHEPLKATSQNYSQGSLF